MEILDQINSAHFGIADISSANRNVLIEIGALIAGGKPLIILRSKDEDGTEIPFNIAGYNCYSYKVSGDQIVISDASSTNTTLHEFIARFVGERLVLEKGFQDAKEWLETYQ